jgi:uncharacterized protein YjbJ (UPF0337 family)
LGTPQTISAYRPSWTRLGRRTGVTYTPPIGIIEPNGPRSAAYRGEVMNSDQMKGAAQKTGGKVKEEFGKIAGNPDTQAKGKFDQAKGQARENVGDVKEVVKGNK